MHAAFSRLILPTGNARDLRRLFKRLHQNAAIHVLPHRQSEKSEYGRRDVQQSRAVNALVLLDVRSLHANNSEGTMLNRRPGGLVGNPTRAQMIGMEAVIR